MTSRTIHGFLLYFSLSFIWKDIEIVDLSIFSDMAIRCAYFIVFLCQGNVETDQTAH